MVYIVSRRRRQGDEGSVHRAIAHDLPHVAPDAHQQLEPADDAAGDLIAVALADRLAAQDAKNRGRATDAFLSSVKFEAALWDAAVKLEA